MLIRLHLAELLLGEDTDVDKSSAPKESDSISPITSVGHNFDFRDSTALLQNTLEFQFASEWLLPILNRHPAVAAAAKKNRSVAIRLVYAAGNSTMVEIARAGATEATITKELRSQKKVDGLTVGLTIQHQGQIMNVMPGSDLEAFASLGPIVNGFITTLPDTHYAGDEECTRGLRVHEKAGAPGIVARCYPIDVPKAAYDHAEDHVAGPSSQPPAAAAAPTSTATSTKKSAPAAKKAQPKKKSTGTKDDAQQKKTKSAGKGAEDSRNAKTTKTPTNKKSKEAEADAKTGGDKGDGNKGAEKKTGKKKAQPSNADNDDDAGAKTAATTKPSAAAEKAKKAKASANAKAADEEHEVADLVSKWNQLPAKARRAECTFSTDVLLKMGNAMAKEVMMRALIKAGKIPDSIGLLGKKASSSDDGDDNSGEAEPAKKGSDAWAKKKSTSDKEKPMESKLSQQRKEREAMTVAPVGFKFSKKLQARFDKGDYTAEAKWQIYLKDAEKNRQAVARSAQKKKEAEAAAKAAGTASGEDETSAKKPAAPDREGSSAEDEQAKYARKYIASDNDVGDSSESDSDFEKKSTSVKKATGSATKRPSSNKEASTPTKKSKKAAAESATESRKRSDTMDGADVEDPNFHCPAKIKKKFDSLTSVEEKKQLVADYRKKGREAVAKSKARKAAAAAGKKLVSDDDEAGGMQKTPSDAGAEKSAKKRKESSGAGEGGSSNKRKKKKKKKKSSSKSSNEVRI